ncbi:MAG: 3,4-dehydroadipyl-CoA semialdehyde dehydrogenase [Myxococcota bacterium]|nr:3,4-dehydroadipyl-CoA semialdehyde dehydrogenase [Myxococcota bacterium]
MRLQSYLLDQWMPGEGPTRDLVNPATEEVIAQTTTAGIDFAAALHHARTVGGPALRAMTFAERGGLLKAMSRALYAKREELITLSSRCNGATRGDSKFDIDGATGTLSHYAYIGKTMGDARFTIDGEAEKLSSGARYVGQHVRLPRPGVAVHINAFNFPAWGTFEKIATAILAGMPVVTKPATATSPLTYRMVQILIEEGVVPAGVLGFIAGPAGDLLDHLGPQDCVAFTGSADTAARLRAGPGILERSARINVEADSLNAAVLGPDVGVGDDVWYTFIRNIVKDMTQKTGQKCTAVRRVFVPEAIAGEVVEALVDELSRITVGDPTVSGVDMGPVATAAQLRDCRAGMALLSEVAEIKCGGPDAVSGVGAPEGKGYYIAPTLLFAANAREASVVHRHEVFGPCATVLAYSGEATEAAELVAMGQGCLVSSVYGSDKAWMSDFLMSAACWNGRVVVCSKKVADQTLPPGMVLPNQVHGGPGRAGGGEELGGVRGLDLYTNRTAIQGDRGLLKKILGA